ncbi:MAG TPA: zinc transporter ZupT [Bacilli bacterium]
MILLQTYNLDNQDVLIAFLFTLLAGLATGIGGAFALFAKRTDTKFLSISLGFSAGVMLYVSFIEIFVQAQDSLSKGLGNKLGPWINVISFFGGMAFIAIIDKVIPKNKNPHEVSTVSDLESIKVTPHPDKTQHLLRIGIFTALAIAIHNFPEGIATFLSTLASPKLAIGITVAIALHNIPEGISVYVPIYFSTGSKKKAFLYSLLSGFAEPVGAFIGYLILRPFLSDTLFGILFAGVAGIMVFISLDELLPAAREYGDTHLSIYGVVGGMMLMALSLLLL